MFADGKNVMLYKCVLPSHTTSVRAHHLLPAAGDHGDHGDAVALARPGVVVGQTAALRRRHRGVAAASASDRIREASLHRAAGSSHINNHFQLDSLKILVFTLMPFRSAFSRFVVLFLFDRFWSKKVARVRTGRPG